jgi:hypothetical protein
MLCRVLIPVLKTENRRSTRLGLPDAPGMATSGGSEHPGAREYPQRYAEGDSRRRGLEVYVSAVAGGSDPDDGIP